MVPKIMKTMRMYASPICEIIKINSESAIATVSPGGYDPFDNEGGGEQDEW